MNKYGGTRACPKRLLKISAPSRMFMEILFEVQILWKYFLPDLGKNDSEWYRQELIIKGPLVAFPGTKCASVYLMLLLRQLNWFSRVLQENWK